MGDRETDKSPTATLRVLMVEDNDDHAALMSRALRRAEGDCDVQRVIDGCDAIAYLRGESPFENRIWPDLVLLDINLPKLSGHEVLVQIRADSELSSAVVIILSTSEGDKDVTQAYRERANAYVTKPTDFVQLCGLMNDLVKFWGRWNVYA